MSVEVIVSVTQLFKSCTVKHNEELLPPAYFTLIVASVIFFWQFNIKDDYIKPLYVVSRTTFSGYSHFSGWNLRVSNPTLHPHAHRPNILSSCALY